MANIDAPFGLTPVGTISGTNFRGAELTVTALASYAVDLFVGSPVKIAGSASADGLYGSVELCAAGQAIDYVIVAFRPKFATESFDSAGGAASTDRIIQVIPVFGVIFEIQASGATAITDMGSVCDITAESGNATSGQSTVEADSATYVDSTTSAQLRVLSVSGQTGRSDIATDNIVLRVTVNESNFAFGSLGL